MDEVGCIDVKQHGVVSVLSEVASVRHSAEARVLEKLGDYLSGGVISGIVIAGGRLRKREV